MPKTWVDGSVPYGSILGGISNQNHPIYKSPTRTGYKFLGWFTHPEQGVQVNEYSTVEAKKVGNTYQQTYYAHWEPVNYTITFDVGYGERYIKINKPYGTPLSAPSVSWTGHTFVEWNPKVPSTIPAQDTTYTASWTLNPETSDDGNVSTYTITFDANGGEGGWSKTLPYGAKLYTPTVLWKDHIFIGWNKPIPQTVTSE